MAGGADPDRGATCLAFLSGSVLFVLLKVLIGLFLGVV